MTVKPTCRCPHFRPDHPCNAVPTQEDLLCDDCRLYQRAAGPALHEASLMLPDKHLTPKGPYTAVRSIIRTYQAMGQTERIRFKVARGPASPLRSESYAFPPNTSGPTPTPT